MRKISVLTVWVCDTGEKNVLYLSEKAPHPHLVSDRSQTPLDAFRSPYSLNTTFTLEILFRCIQHVSVIPSGSRGIWNKMWRLANSHVFNLKI